MKKILAFLFVAVILVVSVVGIAQATTTTMIDQCWRYCEQYGCNAPLNCYCLDWTVASCPYWCAGLCDV
jgi:hypothetical protein